MLGSIFGFNARLGRLAFFLLEVALAVVMTLLCFALAWSVFQHTPRGATPSEAAMLGPAMWLLPFFLLATFMLYCMRIRDIGWDPVYVLSGWLLLIAVDKIIALKVPALVIGHGHHATAFGGLINFVFVCVLTFWPSGERSVSPPDDNGVRRAPPDKARGAAPAAVRMIGQPAQAGFGRRGQ